MADGTEASVPRKVATLHACGNFDAEDVALHRLRLGGECWKVAHHVDVEPVWYGRCKSDQGAGRSAVHWLNIRTLPIFSAESDEEIRAYVQRRTERTLPFLLQMRLWPP